MGDKVAEIGHYIIFLNAIGWFTIFKVHADGRYTRCGSKETLEEARDEVIKMQRIMAS